jgi:glycerophosphoryl diester phosphodiesterase
VSGTVFSGRPALVGHRGMGKGVVDGYSENTVESFVAAVAAGLDWVEVDIQRTSDDALGVAHDPMLADGTPLAAMSAAEAAARGVVRLEALLEALPPRAGVVFDVKSSLQDAGRTSQGTTATLLARAVAATDRPSVALSFDPGALRHMREAAPGLALGLLTWIRFPIGHAVSAAAHLDVQVLAAHAGSFWRNAATGRVAVPAVDGIVEAVHDSGRQLLVWCPSERRARSLAAAGVDAMVVDDVPRRLRAVERSTRPAHTWQA